MNHFNLSLGEESKAMEGTFFLRHFILIANLRRFSITLLMPKKAFNVLSLGMKVMLGGGGVDSTLWTFSRNLKH